MVLKDRFQKIGNITSSERREKKMEMERMEFTKYPFLD